MKQLDIEAVRENLPRVIDFIGETLDETGCGHKARFQIETAAEEVFVNIASYAYDPDVGPATIRIETAKDPLTVIMSFIDHGKPYDPLAKPDVKLDRPMKERKKGGMGIFMVKKTMDDVRYAYRDGRNILTLSKNIE